jgi:hypothetical protein
VSTSFLGVKQYGCVVEEDVDLTKAIRSGIDHRLYVILIRHVRLCEQRNAFRTLDPSLWWRYDRQSLLLRPLRLRRKTQGDGPANARTLSGDDSHFSFNRIVTPDLLRVI